MFFHCVSSEKTERAFFALQFLQKAIAEKTIYEIENIDELINALDISQDLAFAEQQLKSNHIGC